MRYLLQVAIKVAWWHYQHHIPSLLLPNYDEEDEDDDADNEEKMKMRRMLKTEMMLLRTRMAMVILTMMIMKFKLKRVFTLACQWCVCASCLSFFFVGVSRLLAKKLLVFVGCAHLLLFIVVPCF